MSNPDNPVPPPQMSQRCQARAKVRDEDGQPVRDPETGKVQYRPCRNWAMKGAKVCRFHGANPRMAAERYQELRVEGKISRRIDHIMEDVGLPPEVDDPLNGLLMAVRRSGSMVYLLEIMVGELDLRVDRRIDDELDMLLGVGIGRRGMAIAGPDNNGNGAPHVVTKMYGEWLDRHARICKLALDAGLEERQVRVAEDLGERMAKAIDAVLEELDLSAEQRAKAMPAMVRHLRELGPGQPA